MTTDELTAEKRIATHPPIPSPETLAFPEPDAVIWEPPSTTLLLEGLPTEELTADFLIGIHDLADDHALTVESISVRRGEHDER